MKNKKFNYTYFLTSLEDQDFTNSEDTYLLFSWEPNLNLKFLVPGLKTKFGKGFSRKGFNRFVAAGVAASFILLPKNVFAKEIPKNSPSNNNPGIVIYCDGKPGGVLFDPEKKELALSLIANSKIGQTSAQNKDNLALVPSTPPSRSTLRPLPNKTERSMVLRNNPTNRAMILRKPANRAMVTEDFYIDRNYSVEFPVEYEVGPYRPTKALFSLPQMQKAIKSDYGIDAGIHASGLNAAEMTLAEKDEQIRYYRVLSKVILGVSLMAIAGILYKWYLYKLVSKKNFEKLFAKYLLSKTKNIESSKLHNELFPKWNDMVKKNAKALQAKNMEIQKLKQTFANDISGLQLVIDMLTDERDTLLKEIKFLKEHGSP